MRKIIPLCLFMVAFLMAANVSAQFKLFIKATGSDGKLIEGESTVKGHENEIEAYSYGQDMTNCCSTPGGGGGGVGKATIGKLIVNINLGKASADFKKILLTGRHMKNIIVTALKSGGSQINFYKITMEDVTISQVTEGEPDLSSTPTQQVSFNAARIGWAYTPQRPDGGAGTPVKFGWDVQKNSEWSGF